MSVAEHHEKGQERKIRIFWLKIKWKPNPKIILNSKVEKEIQLKTFFNPRFIPTALSGGSNKFYPTNGNDNNNELENLYKYYKSTGQVN